MAKQFKKIVSKVQKVKKKAPVATAPGKRFTGGTVALPTGEFIATVGRRKSASARVRVYLKSGDYVVNGKPMAQYFSAMLNPETRFLLPFQLTETLGKFAVSVSVTGSGVAAQLDAAVLGIARALIQLDEAYRPVLRQAGLLTRDPRMKETRKPNMGGKARRRRQSPRR